VTEWTDAHLDLAYLAVAGRDVLTACPDPAQGCISIPDLRDGSIGLIFGTIFIEPGKPDEPGGYADSDDIEGAERAGLRQIQVYEDLERTGHISIVRTRRDLDHLPTPPSVREGVGGWVEDVDRSRRPTHPLAPSLKGRGNAPIKVVILMEGADPIRSPEHVKEWFERGVRIVGLTWAMGSRYAGGNAKPGPLTGAGREMIAALDELGIVHDLSHLSDPAVDELLSITRGRIIASHSNARSLMADEPAQAIPGVSAGLERHLPDAYIHDVSKRGGVVGLNLFSKFLIGGRRVAAGQRATIEDCIRHVEHIAQVMGHRRGVGLGSDADGGFLPIMLPEGLDHPRKWVGLLDGLSRAGWSKEDVDGFARGNWLRFLHEALPNG